MLDEEQVNELVENYGVGKETVLSFCDILFSYPIVRNEDESLFYECLEAAISAKTSGAFLGDSNKKIDDNYIAEKCLYRIYSEDAIPYLSNRFKEENGIE
jgi:hypothetical protein